MRKGGVGVGLSGIVNILVEGLHLDFDHMDDVMYWHIYECWRVAGVTRNADIHAQFVTPIVMLR